ncbi:MAG TPA: AAA family ATPase [Nitrososphaeraceae archaeon]|nr:AAA family ATPase [Nitrososphaeraceae archaeon]
MTKCIAFHSYKGGTGKTTLACNSAAALAKKGFNVCLLDLDLYAPSFQIYFQKEPKKGINDLLDTNARVEDVMVDVTDIINNVAQDKDLTETGKLWIGFSNPKKKDVFKLEMAETDTKKEIIRRFIKLRERLMSEYDADYIILDTSPGMRFWSINTLAIADILLLTLKSGDLDIEGTKRVVDEIYKTFTKFGSKAFLLCNRVAGYCVPHAIEQNTDSSYSTSFLPGSISPSANHSQAIMQSQEEQIQDALDTIDKLSTELGIRTISSIPCFCDIQFLRREFLTALKYPEHPFAKQIQQLTNSL